MKQANKLIPKSFTLGGIEWSVEVDNERLDLQKFYGTCNYNEQKIRYSTQTANTKLKSDFQLLTFNHELVHAILDAMGEGELNSNEKFVDIFARYLTESQLTRK